LITTGFLSHQMQNHQLDLPTQFHSLDLQDILTSCAQTCNEENLLKIFSTCQLFMARNQEYTSIYHTSAGTLIDTVPKIQLENYQRVLTMCTLPPGYEDGLVSNNWSDLLQNTRDRLKFELLTPIISTKLDELFHSEETCQNINSLKQGEDYPTSL